MEEIGFSLMEIGKLIGDDSNDSNDSNDSAASEAIGINPVTEYGTIWTLGRHKLTCGDSTDKEFITKFCPHANLLLTDPPYGISIVRKGTNTIGSGGLTKSGKFYRAKKFIPVANDDSNEVSIKAIEICKELTDNQIIFGGNYFASTLPNSQCWIVWDKKNEGTYFADCELAWTSFDKAVKKYEFMWNGFFREGSKEEELKTRVHPNQKPVGLLKLILNDHSKEGDTVLDTFAGSGSTLIACEKTNRICFAVEFEPRYVDFIIKRWQDITGQEAIREDGKTYNELKTQQNGQISNSD